MNIGVRILHDILSPGFAFKLSNPKLINALKEIERRVNETLRRHAFNPENPVIQDVRRPPIEHNPVADRAMRKDHESDAVHRFGLFRFYQPRLDKYLCLGQILAILARKLVPMCRVEINLQYPTSRFPKLDKSQVPGPSHREISRYAAQHRPRRIHIEILRDRLGGLFDTVAQTVRRAWPCQPSNERDCGTGGFARPSLQDNIKYPAGELRYTDQVS